MTARFSMIGALLLATAATASAEPAKTQPQANGKPAAAPSVVLASADQVHPPVAAADQPAGAPVKHRAARVTTCRCGDQIAEQPEQ